MNKKQYQKYLQSDLGWKIRSKLYGFFKGDKCELCQVKSNFDMHHLTYENLKHEKIGDLAKVCSACHLALHLGEDFKLINKPQYWGCLIVDHLRDNFEIKKVELCKYLARRTIAVLILRKDLRSGDAQKIDRMVTYVIYHIIKDMRGKDLAKKVNVLALDLINYLHGV